MASARLLALTAVLAAVIGASAQQPSIQTCVTSGVNFLDACSNELATALNLTSTITGLVTITGNLNITALNTTHVTGDINTPLFNVTTGDFTASLDGRAVDIILATERRPNLLGLLGAFSPQPPCCQAACTFLSAGCACSEEFVDMMRGLIKEDINVFALVLQSKCSFPSVPTISQNNCPPPGAPPTPLNCTSGSS
jgi:hypothetical protein